MTNKRKFAFLQFLIAFIVLMLLLSLMAIVGEMLQIGWIIKYTETGFLIGNIVGAGLGVYNIIVPLIERAIFKELGIFFYVILVMGFFCMLINIFQILEFFGLNFLVL